MITYKFRLYPNKEHREKLDCALDICRQTYNILLEELNNQVIIDKNIIASVLPDLKICEPRFKDVYSKALQPVVDQLFRNLSALSAIKKKGRRVGRLRFKGKGWYKTFSYNQSGFKLDSKTKKLSLSKIGDVNIKLHREVEGVIKQVTLKKSNNNWYAYIITDAKIKRKCGKKTLGVDLGINNFLVDSEGSKVEHPKILENNLNILKIKQKKLSKKKKGSNNRKKAKKKLSKLHEKITNTRNDFLHKTSTELIKKSKIIILEKLNIKQMMQQPHFNAKNIADSSWNRFVQLLTYKADNAGCKIIRVNPKNTTKTCSNCGSVQDMPLHKRTYECQFCSLVLDRDHNAAINIKQGGLKQKGLGSERAYVEINPSVPLVQGLSKKQEATTSNL